jgi:four helix bundle protein
MRDESDHGGRRHQDLRRRTLEFALRIIRLCGRLPNTPEAWAIRRQLVKSGTSPGAHYREACRGRSNAEFTSKIDGGLQELEETGYWLEILAYSGICNDAEVEALRAETEELTAIFTACSTNAKARD